MGGDRHRSRGRGHLPRGSPAARHGVKARGVRHAARAAGRASVRHVGRAVVRCTVPAVFVLAILAGVAFAACPALSRRHPSPGASLAQAPTQVSIVFGERPDFEAVVDQRARHDRDVRHVGPHGRRGRQRGGADRPAEGAAGGRLYGRLADGLGGGRPCRRRLVRVRGRRGGPTAGVGARRRGRRIDLLGGSHARRDRRPMADVSRPCRAAGGGALRGRRHAGGARDLAAARARGLAGRAGRHRRGGRGAAGRRRRRPGGRVRDVRSAP